MPNYMMINRYFRMRVLAIMMVWGMAACSSSGGEKSISEAEITQSPVTIFHTADVGTDERNYLRPSDPPDKRFISSVRIINVGNQSVKNPRVKINGFMLPLTTQEFLDGVIQNSADAQDRLLRLYYTMINYTVHGDLPLGEDTTPLSWFLGHGYGLCEIQTYVQGGFWDAMGHRSRNGMGVNHTAGEVEIGDRTVLLDTDLVSYYMKHDNWTLASADDVRGDGMLALRSSHYRDYNRYPRLASEPEIDMWNSSEKIASIYNYTNVDPQSPITLGRNQPLQEAFELILRPGESYGWHTDKSNHLNSNTWAASFGESFSWRWVVDTVGREMTWETNLDFGKPSHFWGIANSGRAIVQNPAGSAVIDSDMPVSLLYDLPFPIIGAELMISEGETPASDTLIRIRVSGSTGNPVILDVPFKTLTSGFFSIDSRIQSLPYPQKKVTIELWPVGQGGVNRSLALKGVSLKLYCQSTVFALRGLWAGKNELTYSDASNSRLVRVEVQTSSTNTQVLRFSQGEFLPAANQVVAESNLVFVWPEATGAALSGYHLQISAFEDMRYPLSPTFDRLIQGDQIKRSGERVTFGLPWRGMLPVNRTLYWRVRPFGTDRWAGAWSEPQSFVVRGPVAPEQIRVTYTGGKVELSWLPGTAGSRPVLYEIHHSTQEGFLPISENHRILGFSDQPVIKYIWTDMAVTDWPVVPSTLLTTTAETRYTLHDPGAQHRDSSSSIGAHIRIIAVDPEGSRSAPSPQIHLTTPYLNTPSVVSFPAGDISWKMPVITSAGRVTVKLVGGLIPMHLGLWEKPQYTFSMGNVSRNGSWRIDTQTGIIQGSLSNGEEVSMMVDVADQFNNRDSKQVRFVGR